MQPIRDNKESKGNKVYSIISPVSLIAIVMLNFLLIYLNLVNLENQTIILRQIEENTELAIENQHIGLNASAQNKEMLELIVQIEALSIQTLHNLNISDTQ